jgi:SAM-dependent methyltransferase
VTSGGVIFADPLRKVQCPKCGVLRQYPHFEAMKTELYRDKYELYHRRPGTEASEAARYASMAVWILGELEPFAPASVLDVGCGGGLLLGAIMDLRPSLEYAGIDPSTANSDLARSRGFAVTTGFIPETRPPKSKYDLVLASNVMSHVVDPITFFGAMAGMTEADGRVLIYSHDGSKPGADQLWTDVESSFSRQHLGALAAKAGLELLDSRGIARPAGQADKEVLVFKRAASPAAVRPLPTSEREALLAARREYVAAWPRLARRLAERANGSVGPVLNFGASFWSMILAAYCPEYWERVEACLVDEGEGSFMGKPIVKTSELSKYARPLIVLGTNPSSHAQLRARLSSAAEVVTWDDLITR